MALVLDISMSDRLALLLVGQLLSNNITDPEVNTEKSMSAAMGLSLKGYSLLSESRFIHPFH